jgi:hypothetical protein
MLNANPGLSLEESKDLNKDYILSSTRLNKVTTSSTLLQEYSSARNPKTPGRMNKSINKTREISNEKNRLFKTKTIANLKNFTNTAKNLKSEKKFSYKTPSNNKSSIFHNDKDLLSFDHTSRNKTVIVEKIETTIKKEKTKPILTYRDESILCDKKGKTAKTPREKMNLSSAFKKESFKMMSDIKAQNNKNFTEPNSKKKEEMKGCF